MRNALSRPLIASTARVLSEATGNGAALGRKTWAVRSVSSLVAQTSRNARQSQSRLGSQSIASSSQTPLITAANARQYSNEQTPTPISTTPANMVSHLQGVFPPLNFPEDVAIRMMTHTSYRIGSSKEGHNTRLGFVGRRVLNAYLMLFLHSFVAPATASSPSSIEPLQAGAMDELQDLDAIVDRVLHTYALGEHVGGVWHLERIMRWTPAVPTEALGGAENAGSFLRSTGLYKVRGATVEAVMGGIFHQFGGQVAHTVFHTRVLPHLVHLLPRTLRQPALDTCEKMGGANAPLVMDRAPALPHAEVFISGSSAAPREGALRMAAA